MKTSAVYLCDTNQVLQLTENTTATVTLMRCFFIFVNINITNSINFLVSNKRKARKFLQESKLNHFLMFQTQHKSHY